jgi:hypothetical protein
VRGSKVRAVNASGGRKYVDELIVHKIVLSPVDQVTSDHPCVFSGASAASAGAEEPSLRGAISALLCGLAGALELAVDARLPRGADFDQSIARLIDRSATASLGLTPSVCGIKSCVPATDIAGNRISSCSYRFLVEAEEQMPRFDTPRV